MTRQLTPETSIEALYVEGRLSLRARKVLIAARLGDIRAIAAYHLDDPRYLTLAGCGKTTRRELNALIKGAYGRLAVNRATIYPPKVADESLPWSVRREMVFNERASRIGETMEEKYRKRCEAYADFILQRRGVPESRADLALHQWFLRECQLAHTGYREEAFSALTSRIFPEK